MVNENLVFARRNFLIKKGMSTKSYPYYSEKHFYKLVNCPYSKEELLAKYPLTQERALELQKQYNEEHPEMQMFLTEEELSKYPAQEVDNG